MKKLIFIIPLLFTILCEAQTFVGVSIHNLDSVNIHYIDFECDIKSKSSDGEQITFAKIRCPEGGREIEILEWPEDPRERRILEMLEKLYGQ